MAAGLGIEAHSGDGNNATATHALVADAIARIRKGEGPQFLELSTYRWREHCGPFYDNDIGYRSEQEFEAWKKRDPVARLETELREAALMSSEDFELMDKDIEAEVMEAFAFAEDSAFPNAADAYTDLYSSANVSGAPSLQQHPLPTQLIKPYIKRWNATTVSSVTAWESMTLKAYSAPPWD